MASNVPSVVTLGNLTIDDTILPNGEVHMAVTGGNALYGVAATRIWTDSAGIVTRVGHGYPDRVRHQFEQASISLDGWCPATQEPLRTWVLYEDTGTRRYFSRHFEASQIQLVDDKSFDRYLEIICQHQEDLSPQPTDIPHLFHSANVFHLAPIVPVCQIELLHYLSNNTDGAILLDPHYDLMTTCNEPVFDDLLANINIFLPSEEDLYARYGDFKQDTLKRLVERGPKVAGAKLGEGGCLLYDKEQDKFYRVPIYPTTAIDVTGAGDAFCAGFAAALAQGDNIADAAACATASASFAIQEFGGLHLLRINRHEALQRKEWVLDRIV